VKPAEFVIRLNATPFKGDLGMLERAEAEFSRSMDAYKGYDALAIAFMRLFLETIPAFNTEIVPNVARLTTAQHHLFVERLVHAFLTLRAARTTAHGGYPLQAFTLLRNIYDDCLLVSAVVQGLATFEELAGVKPNEAFDYDRMRKNRMAVERQVRTKMDGAESGLPSELRDHLKMMDRMYDMETHGGRVSTAYNKDWLLGSAPLSVVPVFKEDAAALFINRYLESAWLVHRLLPLIQLPGTSLPKEWGSKWRVVDAVPLTGKALLQGDMRVRSDQISVQR
jgi:hypothetical protein